jgi:hypothetical protein
MNKLEKIYLDTSGPDMPYIYSMQIQILLTMLYILYTIYVDK